MELVELVSEAAGAGVEAAVTGVAVALVVLSILTSSIVSGLTILIPFLSRRIVAVLGGGGCDVGCCCWAGGGCCCCCGGCCCCC